MMAGMISLRALHWSWSRVAHGRGFDKAVIRFVMSSCFDGTGTMMGALGKRCFHQAGAKIYVRRAVGMNQH